ncbi:hypothetical protein JXB28_00330 [Candidatus Woesearchaeota archaeon]|nr:hypothetical protein [Candidatus Woesearchaeota archaeon]
MFKAIGILLLALLIGWAFGKLFGKKKGKGYSWPAFWISLFIFLGGLEYLFDVLGNTFEFLGKIAGFLFWMGFLLLVYYVGKWFVDKAKKQRKEPPSQEPPAAPPTAPAV